MRLYLAMMALVIILLGTGFCLGWFMHQPGPVEVTSSKPMEFTITIETIPMDGNATTKTFDQNGLPVGGETQ